MVEKDNIVYVTLQQHMNGSGYFLKQPICVLVKGLARNGSTS